MNSQNQDLFPVLIYHRLTGDLGQVGKYMLTEAAFGRHLEILVQHEAQCLTADDLLRAPMRHGRYLRRTMITFDDGYEDNFTLAFPALMRHQLPATFFVVSDWIGQKGYISWSQLCEMRKAGMSIQSHTASHRYLSQLTRADVHEELLRSKNTVEDHLATPVHSLSLPYGDAPAGILRQAVQAGYQRVFTSRTSYARPERATVPRINIWGGISEHRFAKIVSGTSGALFLPRAVQLGKSLVKRALHATGWRPRSR